MKRQKWSNAEKWITGAVTFLCLLIVGITQFGSYFRIALKMPLRIQPPAGEQVTGLGWSPDSGSVAAAFPYQQKPSKFAGNVGIWSISTGALTQTLTLNSRPAHPYSPPGTSASMSHPTDLEWLRSGSILIAGWLDPPRIIEAGSTRSKYFAPRWRYQRNFAVRITSTPSGKDVSFHSTNLHILRFRKERVVHQVLNYKVPSYDQAVALTPDAKRCLIIGHPWPIWGPGHSQDKLRLLDSQSGKQLWSRPEGEVRSVVLSPNGNLAYATFTRDHAKARLPRSSTVSSWIEAIDIADGHAVWRTKERPSGLVDSPSVSPKGEFVAVRDLTGDIDTKVRVFTTKDGQQIATLSSRTLNPFNQKRRDMFPTGQVVAFSPDGKYLALSTMSEILVWHESAWKGSG